MKTSRLFSDSGRWLKEPDLNGKRHEVIVDGVDLEDVDDDKQRPVVRFQGKKKGLILNRTNCASIESAFGDETDDWTGKTIILYPTTTLFKGKTVPCIRIDIPNDNQGGADDEGF